MMPVAFIRTARFIVARLVVWALGRRRARRALCPRCGTYAPFGETHVEYRGGLAVHWCLSCRREWEGRE